MRSTRFSVKSSMIFIDSSTAVASEGASTSTSTLEVLPASSFTVSANRM